MHKTLCLLGLASFIVITARTQTVISYAGQKVDGSELLRAYNKNKTPGKVDKDSLLLYAQLYSNFKLKVQAAKDRGYDTMPMLLSDVDVFKNQVMDNYLADEAGIKKMQAEAFVRSQKDLRVTYYSMPVGKDSAASLALMKEAQQLLNSGSKVLPQKFSAVELMDLGYITVFSLPYFFENIAYNTAVGTASTPVVTNNRVHILKVEKSRPAAGLWKARQILLAYPPEADANFKTATKNRADSIYRLIINGMPFSEAAEKFSNDRITNLTGGLLPTFGTGRYAPEFEEQVFSLKKNKDISKPFATSFGYHIVMRDSVIPVVTDAGDQENQYNLRQKMSQDSRMQDARDAFKEQIITRTGWMPISAGTKKKALDAVETKSYAAADAPLGHFKNGTRVNANEWYEYAKKYYAETEAGTEMNVAALYHEFEKQVASNEYRKNLATYNPDFAYQVLEFKEGSMLFDIMEKEIWGKAAADEAGLQKFYAANSGKYTWKNSADAIVVHAADKTMGESAMQSLKAGKNLQDIIMVSNGKLTYDSGRYEIAELIDSRLANNPVEGGFSSLAVNADGEASFVLFKKIYAPGGQRTFKDARGMLVTDYQDALEEQWLADLRKKYNLVIFKPAIEKLAR